MLHLLFIGSLMITTYSASQAACPQPDIDSQDMFQAIYTFPEQCERGTHIGKRIKLEHRYDRIRQVVFVGMGGSGMAGTVAKTMMQDNATIPIMQQQDYELPGWVDERTLVIIVSYSGNTEETLSCFDQAHQQRAQIIGVTSGGQLLDRLLAHNYDHVVVPGGMQPRAALGYLMVPLCYLMVKLELMDRTVLEDIHNSIVQLKKERLLFASQENSNPTFAFAQFVSKCLPVVYSTSDMTACVAKRWLAQLAENSKLIARTHQLPELNHNEIVGWKKDDTLLKRSVVLWLLDEDTHPRNRKRYHITKEIINEMPFAQLDVESKGASPCERLLYLVHFGDWLSYWCALVHNVDPTPIAPIQTLKKRIVS